MFKAERVSEEISLDQEGHSRASERGGGVMSVWTEKMNDGAPDSSLSLISQGRPPESK